MKTGLRNAAVAFIFTAIVIAWLYGIIYAYTDWYTCGTASSPLTMAVAVGWPVFPAIIIEGIWREYKNKNGESK